MFENVTVYDQAALYAFTDVYTHTIQRVRYRLHLAVLLIGGGICTMEGLFLLFVLQLQDYSSLVLTGVVLFIGPCAVIKGLFLRHFMARNTRKRMNFRNGKCRFFFDMDYFETEQPGIQSTYCYDRIYKAYEAPGYFVLFLDKVHGVILDMGGFTQGTADEFRSFLTERLERPIEYVRTK